MVAGLIVGLLVVCVTLVGALQQRRRAQIAEYDTEVWRDRAANVAGLYVNALHTADRANERAEAIRWECDGLAEALDVALQTPNLAELDDVEPGNAQLEGGDYFTAGG